ncbi:MAG TPA: aldehyde ferredoxin oxidoreductase family protein [Dehalococcoidales bacterium]|nr:aldehyde ferredoxin oxidoreductase family protein [Dehalococcoidales bacterium]
MNGYMGKILRINLTQKTSSTEDLPQEILKKFMGGVGFAFSYLYKEFKPGTDPLDKDNLLILAVGPLNATGTPCANRMVVASKSPLTNTIAASYTGGYFPSELKKAGYDMVIIEGKAEKLTYVCIKDGDVSFRNAEKYSGMNTTDTQLFIKDELRDQNYRVACIGPAGERLIPMACIINERRAAGRKGMGAVMGSKNLKAIAVMGSGKPTIADPAKFGEARRELVKAMRDSPMLYPTFSKTGTPCVVDVLTGLGIFPINNWLATGEKDMVPTLGIAAQDKFITDKVACDVCPVACSQVKKVVSGPYAGYLSEGPEFETTYSLGSNLGIDYMPAVIAGDRLCDEYGLDTISAGVAIGMAMELYEAGVLTKKDTNNLDLKFGNHQAMIEMLRMIAFEEGLGAILAKGVKKAAEELGKRSEIAAIHVKGLELPAYDVRGAKAHGLNFATAYNGADHCRGYAFQEIFSIPIPNAVDRFAAEGKGKLTKWNQDTRCSTTDCPTLCGFIMDMAIPGDAPLHISRLLTAVTGINWTVEDVTKVGERVNNVARLFNIREGFTRQDDGFPERLMTEPIKAGASKGAVISQNDLKVMLDEYYEARGWDLKGVPTKSKLDELGIKA